MADTRYADGMGGKLDTRAIGLDVSLHFARWLTGTENLHYGLWTDIDVSAGNLGRAQDAYSDLLFTYLPNKPVRILDIGGGAGVTAAKLIAMGHDVQIVVPSPVLADRCKANAPSAHVHLSTFEDFQTADRFDLCLFSESFQYVALNQGLSKALGLLAPGGSILIADCFRSDAYKSSDKAKVGGGHPWRKFEAELARLPLQVKATQDITRAVAPSVEIEQGLFNVLGHAVRRVDVDMACQKPAVRWTLQRMLGMTMRKRKRDRLAVRLMENTRTAEAFCTYNTYRILHLEPT